MDVTPALPPVTRVQDNWLDRRHCLAISGVRTFTASGQGEPQAGATESKYEYSPCVYHVLLNLRLSGCFTFSFSSPAEGGCIPPPPPGRVFGVRSPPQSSRLHSGLLGPPPHTLSGAGESDPAWSNDSSLPPPPGGRQRWREQVDRNGGTEKVRGGAGGGANAPSAQVHGRMDGWMDGLYRQPTHPGRRSDRVHTVRGSVNASCLSLRDNNS